MFEQIQDLPASFDCRQTAGYMPVRNQGGCGACWAFAVLGVLEYNILINDGVERNLSEQWIVSCNMNNFTCSWGGDAFHALRYLELDSISNDPAGDRGAVLEADFPYAASQLKCGCPYPHYYYIDDYDLYNPSDVNSLKQVIMTYGPAYSGVRADFSFHYYNGGVYNNCGSSSTNHAVNIVGWDDNPPDGGPDCPGVWIIRNSWGENWGENGYMRIEYGCNGVGNSIYYVEYSSRDFVVSPLREATFFGEEGSTIDPAAIEYMVINNSGVNDINWTITHNEPWVSVVPDEGVLSSLGNIEVQVFINEQGNLLSPGSYSDTLTFSGSSGQEYQEDVYLTIQSTDYFTERMPNYRRLMDYLILTLTPCESPASYTACTKRAWDFPTDPAGGFELTLGDNDYEFYTLSQGRQVKLYGQSYDSFYVGSNGYITFEEGDTSDARTINTHFSLKRISALLEELDPSSQGTVSVKELDDRVAVTFDDVDPFSNSFQIEMFYSGVIRITWLEIFVQWPVVGISNGEGTPADFAESDISAYQISNADVCNDCMVDFLDYVAFSSAWLTTPADADWDIGCEFSVPADGVIDAFDLQILVNDWLAGKQVY